MTEKQAKDKLVSWANVQLGYAEGENNYNRYAPIAAPLIGWDAQNQPWCDIFTDAGFIECFGLEAASAMTYQPIGRGSAACRISAKFFKDNGAWFSAPHVGDIIFFYYSGDINHQGIVVGVSGGVVTTVEGNSSDAVRRNSYATGSSIIAGYGRPKWSVVSDCETTDPPAPAEQVAAWPLPELKRGDKGEVVRAAQFLLIGRECPCGIWGADGDFGKETEAATFSFQHKNSLDEDGIIGRRTWGALLGI